MMEQQSLLGLRGVGSLSQKVKAHEEDAIQWLIKLMPRA